MGVLRIMTAAKGDEVVSWGGTKLKDRESDREASAEEVKKEFDDLVKANWTIFETKSASKAGLRQSKNFDATVEEYVAVPQILGG